MKLCKQSRDQVLPKKKQDLIKLYHDLKSRPYRVFDYTAIDNFLLFIVGW